MLGKKQKLQIFFQQKKGSKNQKSLADIQNMLQNQQKMIETIDKKLDKLDKLDQLDKLDKLDIIDTLLVQQTETNKKLDKLIEILSNVHQRQEDHIQQN
ncbi:hypothetical protein TTHERM_00804780 (macronuclear) [Tetrahymena thermophila SB210]|uniref:Uncharacterized protein n=1 Tax=Tetrahymena thermophila (strain SB210) TaxID=312017 RepID=Q235C1_TETTS|nr:hypothetical protein TTHERM_00804780 [Tetrahymena thermophila SB210]EAR92182.2 hypothetical protein TTHERM_00804780 [Tetrahymena thermophila SB210]|eukprot:XP_001012427.2 hypothetical protein TTHERM_00804780 [Tetrahymena thermophila SB210]